MKKFIMPGLMGSLLLAQIILVFVPGMVNEAGFKALKYTGWIIWGISVVLGLLPIMHLKKKGGVAKGKSYVHTTVLVDTGIYSIVRHPQYTAGMLFSLALILISQSLLITAFGIVVITWLYIDTRIADKHEIKKFGDDYKRYMEKVPGTNFLLGLIRIWIHKKSCTRGS